MYTVFITVSWSESDIVIGNPSVTYEKAQEYLKDAFELLNSNAVKIQSIRVVKN